MSTMSTTSTTSTTGITIEDMCQITQHAHAWIDLKTAIDDARSYILMTQQNHHSDQTARQLASFSMRIEDMLSLGKG